MFRNRTITFNYEDSKNSNSQGKNSVKRNKIFKIQNSGGITFKHRENDFVDFKYDNLMPRMISNEGPKVAVADVNGDGLDDFYIGGAKNQSGELYIQTNNQNKIFKRHIKIFKDRASEDVGVVFFDIDNDDDMDLYVVSGGGESFDNLTTKDRLYMNDGFGNFNKSNLHPQLNFNGSCAVSGVLIRMVIWIFLLALGLSLETMVNIIGVDFYWEMEKVLFMTILNILLLKMLIWGWLRMLFG